jgi:ATP phosphoribosyltransferase regulatory subunit
LALDRGASASLYDALAGKDTARLSAQTAGFPVEARRSLLALVSLYGGADTLAAARRELPALPVIHAALDDLQWLAAHARQAHPEVEVGFDLADLSGYAYYSGAHFSVYAAGSSDALLRGGRYDEVGAVFGRTRPAVGFSLDVKALAALSAGKRLAAAIRAPWAEDAALRATVRRLREQGDTVVCILPGHEHEGQEFDCDRELVAVGGAWAVRSL